MAAVFRDALQKIDQRRRTAAVRAKPVGNDYGAAHRAPVLFNKLAEGCGVVMPELTHEYSPRCCPLDAPSRNGIGTLVHVDPHLIACQQSKQIPEKMQRRGKRRRAFAAYQRCELAGCRDATRW